MEHLINGLVKKGHTVTMIGCPGSYLEGVKIVEYPDNVMEKEGQDRVEAAESFITSYLDTTDSSSKINFDLIHNHMGGATATKLVNSTSIPVVTTLHGQYVPNAFDEHTQSGSYVAISMDQSHRYPQDTNIVGMVYNSIDFSKYLKFAQARKFDYVTNINRYSPLDEKGFMPTLRIAEHLPSQLFILSMFVQPQFKNDELYHKIRDSANRLPNVVLLDGITECEKMQLVSRARAFVFPLLWPEPFGLAPVEAQALGTIPIVYNNGSMSEVVSDGYSGYVIPKEASITEFANKIKLGLDKIDPMNCIKFVTEKFSISKMAENYEEIYRKILG